MGFSRSTFLSGVYMLYFFLAIDVVINGGADKVASQANFYGLMGAQLAGILCCLLAILMLMWHTFLFSYGLLGMLCTRFQLRMCVLFSQRTMLSIHVPVLGYFHIYRPIFFIWPVYFIMTIAFRAYRLANWDNLVVVCITTLSCVDSVYPYA